MATVQVNSWTEFVAAVAVSGDTVVCPEGAVWDMNEIAPGGVSGFQVNCAEVHGNGTEIKNLRLQSGITLAGNAAQTVDVLHLTNLICETGAPFGCTASVGTEARFSGCKFSGILPQNAQYFCTVSRKNAYFSRCSFALEYGYSGSSAAAISQTSASLTFCRVNVQLPNGALFYPFAEWSYVRIDCPAMRNLYIIGAANVYDGDLPQLTGVIGTASATYPSVYNRDSMPDFAGAANVLGVTEAQLHDAAYLASIGFPIGVEV